MQYVSLDIETTGLDPEKDQVLEIAAVFDDLKTPLRNLPTYHLWVKHERLEGTPEALAMNKRYLDAWATSRQKQTVIGRWAEPHMVGDYLGIFLAHCYGFKQFSEMVRKQQKITVAGKNAGSFDLAFLRQLPNTGRGGLVPVGATNQELCRQFHHRVIDPANFFLWAEDEEPLSLDECWERAGLHGVELEEHNPLHDAWKVVYLTRRHFGLLQSLDLSKE